MINGIEYPLHKLMATTKDADLGRCKVRRCVHTRLLQRAHVARRALHMRRPMRPMSSKSMQELRELIDDKDKYALPTIRLMAAGTAVLSFPSESLLRTQISRFLTIFFRMPLCRPRFLSGFRMP